MNEEQEPEKGEREASAYREAHQFRAKLAADWQAQVVECEAEIMRLTAERDTARAEVADLRHQLNQAALRSSAYGGLIG